jgi:Lar family restriction alleviation protein
MIKDKAPGIRPKSCPFCGADDISIGATQMTISTGDPFYESHAVCNECGVTMNANDYSLGIAINEVKEKWNRRESNMVEVGR